MLPIFLSALAAVGATPASSGDKPLPEVVSICKIWDQAPHNAFTDLIRFGDQWLCTFREASGHAGPQGKIRIIASKDAKSWHSVALIAESGYDLRDPKLSLMPDGRLMLLMGATVWEHAKYLTRAPRVAFSTNATQWTPLRKVLAEDHWLWRVTWHKGVGYCLSKLGEGNNPRRGFLYATTDGIDWRWITEFNLDGVSETTLRFLDNDEMVALIRPGYIGHSKPPYRDWKFHKMTQKIGGPNFIRLPNGRLWAAARLYGKDGRKATVLAEMTPDSYTPVLTLPSGGDNSYPGMVWCEAENLLYMSYYSSHEGKASIYLAKIRLPD
ncbi:MAG: exo-alpha-sialidase [Phycisphaerae bacterium]|nr:exo-alpha-sialidase [Phycisphaerae bacterium]